MGMAKDTVLEVPFHPRLCKLHLLKRKVLQYVASWRAERDGGGDGTAVLPVGRVVIHPLPYFSAMKAH